MRTTTAMVRAALTCALLGAAGTACGDGGRDGAGSAGELLDEANATMRELSSVTVDVTTAPAAGGDEVTNRLVTDLKSRCTSRTTWSKTGATLEQIRIGETDYVRPDRAYLQAWKGKGQGTGDGAVAGETRLWAKRPADTARPDDGLSSCTRRFDSFGTAKQAGSARVDGREARRVVVTDEADKGATYTFYVAAEGRPYLLRTVYEGPDYRTTTSFGRFDEPLDVRAPEPSEVLSVSGDAG